MLTAIKPLKEGETDKNHQHYTQIIPYTPVFSYCRNNKPDG